MTWPSPPPVSDLLLQLQTLMLPAAGAAALAYGVCLALSPRLRHVATSLGLIAGVLAGNWANSPFPLAHWKDPTTARHYLPHGALGLIGLGLLTLTIRDLLGRAADRWRVLALVLIWLIHAAGLYSVSRYWLPATASPGSVAGFVLLALALWWTLDRIASHGIPGEAGLVAYLCAATAGGMMLFAHYASAMDFNMILGCSCLGLGIVAFHAGGNLRAIAPATAGLVPGILAIGYDLTTSALPAGLILLAAVVGLATCVGLVPSWCERKPRIMAIVRVGLLMVLSMGLLLAAAQYEVLPWDETW